MPRREVKETTVDTFTWCRPLIIDMARTAFQLLGWYHSVLMCVSVPRELFIKYKHFSWSWGHTSQYHVYFLLRWSSLLCTTTLITGGLVAGYWLKDEDKFFWTLGRGMFDQRCFLRFFDIAIISEAHGSYCFIYNNRINRGARASRDSQRMGRLRSGGRRRWKHPSECWSGGVSGCTYGFSVMAPPCVRRAFPNRALDLNEPQNSAKC